MDRVEELITEVFKDPVTARMWWFEQNQGSWSDIRGAGESLDELVALCRRRDGLEHPPRDEDTAGEAVDENGQEPPAAPILAAFLSGVNDRERASLLIRLTDILDAYDRPDLVRRLHESWSVE